MYKIPKSDGLRQSPMACNAKIRYCLRLLRHIMVTSLVISLLFIQNQQTNMDNGEVFSEEVFS